MASGRSSTPTTPTSRKTVSDHEPTTASRMQGEMKDLCGKEIGAHTWEYDADDISRMFSPKKLKEGYTAHDILSSDDLRTKFDCAVDRPCFGKILDQVEKKATIPSFNSITDERSAYKPLIDFLNNGVVTCHKGLDDHLACTPNQLDENVPHKDMRWFRDLFFIVYDKEMADRIEGSSPLKPDGAGLFQNDQEVKVHKLCWSNTNFPNIPQLELAVEVKKNWVDMFKQAATYARCMFSASPARIWSLVLCFHQGSLGLRFLIFHRGGCTASREICLKEAKGRKAAYRLILTMLLWIKPHHAGFNGSSTDVAFAIPASIDGEEGKVVRMIKRLYHFVAVRTRGTCVTFVSGKAMDGAPDLDFSNVLQGTTRLGSLAQVSNQLEAGSSQTPSQTQSTPETRSRTRKSKTSTQGSSSQSKGAEKEGKAQSDASKPTKGNESASDATNPIVPGTRRFKNPIYSRPLEIKGRDEDMKATLGDFIHKSYWTSELDPIEPELLRKTSGCFGTPLPICSYHPVDPDGLFLSNHIFLPPLEKLRQHWWNILSDEPPTAPDYRRCLDVLLSAIGESLTRVDSSWKICESIIHGLLGWLNYYQVGYLHRDISIGNLLRLKQPRTMKPFKASFPTCDIQMDTDLQQPLVSEVQQVLIMSIDSGSDVIMEDLEKDTLSDGGDVLRTEPTDVISGSQEAADVLKVLETTRSEASKYITQVNEALLKLGIKDQCNAVLTDGDMAAKWKNYFDKMHDFHTKSGTPEFMSSRLHLAMEMYCDHLQSPVDDLHSFFWVAMWAVMFNEHNKERSQYEKWWQEWLAGGSRDKIMALAHMRTHRRRLDHSPIFREMVDVLLEWYAIIEKLADDWEEEVRAREPRNDAVKWYPTHFHLYAYRGAAELLELMLKHRLTMMTHGPFLSTA